MTFEKVYRVDNPLFEDIAFQAREDAEAFAVAMEVRSPSCRIKEVLFVPDGDVAFRMLADLLEGGTDE